MSFLTVALGCAICFGAGVLSPVLAKNFRSWIGSREAEDFATRPVDILHYARKTGQFAEFSPPCEITFIGDSRVEHVDWNEVLDQSGVCNRGISGDSTTGLVNRLPVSLPRSVKVCVVQAGVNDLWRGVSIDAILRNYHHIIQYVVQERDAELIISAVVLVDEARTGLNAQIVELNAALRRLCVGPRIHWLDLNETIAPNGYLQPLYTDDETHFTGKAYRAIASPLRKMLEALIPARNT